MKRLFLFVGLFLLMAGVASAQQTHYLGLDGGNITQCDGLTNHALAGATGRNCRLNHPYWLLDQTTFAWLIAGGDTIQFNDAGPYYDGQTLNGLGQTWAFCGSDGHDCVPPALPSGTLSHPTRILGANAGSCHDSAHTHLVNPTVISMLNGAFEAFNLQGTAYPDIECIEITQHDTCTMAGSGGGQCVYGTNNYGQHGIRFEYLVSQGPSNVVMKDVAVVGLSSQGFLGSKINLLSGDVSNWSDIYIFGNGSAGWDSDGGGCGNGCESVGTMNLSYVDVAWNGCVAVEPYDMTKPVTQNAFNYCFDDSTGGYGDGFSFIAAGNANLNVSHSHFRWNTQDGLDTLHLGDDLTTNPNVSILTSLAEGNEGQTFKMGAGASATAINNVSIANCRVMGTASNFPLNPTGWNTGVSDVCRASGDQWALIAKNGEVTTLRYNTSVGYATTMYDIGCAVGATCTTGTVFHFDNNISKGYPDPGNAGRLASGPDISGGTNPFLNAGSTSTNNLWNTMNTGCPDPTAGDSAPPSVCSDPLLVNESINSIDPNLLSGSPAIGAGTPLGSVTTDYSGNPRPAVGQTEPSIGAFEPFGTPVIFTTTLGIINVLGNVSTTP